MAISTNPKPMIYRNLYENTGTGFIFSYNVACTRIRAQSFFSEGRFCIDNIYQKENLELPKVIKLMYHMCCVFLYSTVYRDLLRNDAQKRTHARKAWNNTSKRLRRMLHCYAKRVVRDSSDLKKYHVSSKSIKPLILNKTAVFILIVVHSYYC